VISLTLPCERRFFPVARLVVGALSTRLELSYEQMDDLQLAVESVLREHAGRGSTATLEIVVGAEVLALSVGPIAPEQVPAVGEPDALRGRRLLGALVEHVEVVERDGDAWIRLEKPIAGHGQRLSAT
jgi:hypothetical protein